MTVLQLILFFFFFFYRSLTRNGTFIDWFFSASRLKSFQRLIKTWTRCCEVKLSVSSPQDEDSEFTLATDFEIGHFFRERIVPRAVLYFTGEALEDDESVSVLLLEVKHAVTANFASVLISPHGSSAASSFRP